MSFNIHTEAKQFAYELIATHVGELDLSSTLSDLFYELEYVYEYTVYTSALLQAMADDLNLFNYWEDVCDEFGNMDIMYVNTAVERYILDEYGDKTLDYFTE